MMRDLSRLLSPKSIAVVGGGAWCASIIAAAKQIGFEGTILPIHPKGKVIAGLQSLTGLSDFPGPIDAAFIGVNRHATLDVVAQLRSLNAGGAICFASGFSEAAAEDASGNDLQAQLVHAAGDMPILGPNCYGFLNAMDKSGIWPDQHGLVPVDSGVAILTQSSNILINLTMQTRALPVAQVVACGNQAQTRQTDIALHLLDDPRITAIGLHIEGFGDLRGWEELSAKANNKGIPLIALKSGKSVQAQAAAVSHTASLAGGDTAAQAFLDRLGIRRAHSLPVFLEALKLAHVFGTTLRPEIASISCSGGEAALAADSCVGTGLTFPPLNAKQTAALGNVLGPMVALANPLDYHTYIWRDEDAMTSAWAAMADPEISLTLLVLDYPRSDRCDASDWDIATRAAVGAAQSSRGNFAVVASLPELLPEATGQDLLQNGIVPLCGLDHAIAALDVMTRPMATETNPVELPGPDRDTQTISEGFAKQMLADFGVSVPANAIVTSPEDAAIAASRLGFPVVTKVLGLAHKTGASGLALNLGSKEEVISACQNLAQGDILIEAMIGDPITEVLVGVTRDPAHGFLLTLGAGGTMTEILSDTQSVLIPASREHVQNALSKLRIAPVFDGYRGKPAIDMPALLDMIEAVQSFVIANAASVEEVEINPVICTANGAIAADALIRKTT